MAQNGRMTREELQQVRDWADRKIATGQEPPWAWFQYMKLRETLDTILSGMEVTTQQTASSPEPGLRSGTRLRLVGATDPQDSARHHPEAVAIPLPM